MIKTLKQGQAQFEKALQVAVICDRAEALSHVIYDLEEYKATLEAQIEEVEEQLADAFREIGIAEEVMRSHDERYEYDEVECRRAWR